MLKTDIFPKRQVHLDFHTSPLIPCIGSGFSKEQFQAALKKGNLESITIFAKCHHSMCYYPTKIGIMHPELDFDLTGALMDAAHEIGVRAPIYITAGWSEEDALAHPEWIVRKKNGELSTCGQRNPNPEDPRGDCTWYDLCLGDGSYCQHIYDLTEEICQRYKDIDGLFFDICIRGKACYCDECMEKMKNAGIDVDDDAQVEKFFAAQREVFMRKCGEIMLNYHPNATIFFNSGGADHYRPRYHQYQTHFEMEDLPTAWGGYNKLPLRAKFFNRTGKPYIGMTGKFHLTWGEFGGFKCREALKFEVATMALYGAGCSIGDHMHPDGEMEMQTYENIGYAYDYLEKIAPYCYGGVSTAKLGVYLTSDKLSTNGLSDILIENQIDYDIVFDNNFSRFDTVIFPDGAILDDNGINALNAYVQSGGKVLTVGNALLKDGKFQIDCGAQYIGESEFNCDYILTDVAYKEEISKAPTLCYYPGIRMRLTDGEVLGHIMVPYFSRTMGKYCGHKNTPHDKAAPMLPAIVRKGNVICMAHSMPRMYGTYGNLYYKRYFMLALHQLYSGGTFGVTGLGSQGRATMIRQPEQNRYCLNMVYAAPSRRGCAEIIEDILPVYDIQVRLSVPETIQKCWLLNGNTELKVQRDGAYQYVTVPKLECHETVVMEY